MKKNITLKQYLFGDADGDGIKNIDDPYPLNKRRKVAPKINNKPKHYHTSRLSDREVKLSEQLLAIQRENNSKKGMLKKFLKENPGSKGRIKSVPSTLKKLRERYHGEIMDTAGVMVLTKDRASARKQAMRIKKQYKYDPKETDDYYKNPKGGVYRAYHIGVVSKKKGNRMEVQVKSKKMAKLHMEMHEAYKKNKPLKGFKKRADKLYKQGY